MMILPQLDSNKGFVIGARWVYPVSSPPIASGAVAIKGTEIKAVGARDAILSEYKEFEFFDYNNAIIMPGLINLHSHLDYSALCHLNSEQKLFDWIPLLMKSVANWAPADFRASAAYGAQLAALTGTTFIVDSSYSGLSAEAIAETGLKGLVGLELFGLDKEIAEPIWKSWVERLNKLTLEASSILKQSLDKGTITFTCSPHAPYTVSPALWQLAKSWADSKGLPVLAHLAESKPESAWVRDSDLLINAFLVRVSPSNKDRDTETVLKSIDWRHGVSPVAHLAKHGLLSNTLVAAHCVQIDSADIALLKTAGTSVAHCPRSNARLRNGRAPLPELLEAGVNVGLGTDSLASTDDLNPLAEAAFALNLHRAVEPECTLSSADLIEMMTLAAARAVGLGDKIGSLEPGKSADIAVFKVAPRSAFVLDPPPRQKFGSGQEARVHETTGTESSERRVLAAGDAGVSSVAETDGTQVSEPRFIESTNPADLLVRFPKRIVDVFVDGQRVVEGGRLRNTGQ
ncbi:MAG: amidohydrolase family protein [Candidatus Melainabacteria bacterium]|nr:amidohydrolase family protein [Candidatus Melainabacteria bacterium]